MPDRNTKLDEISEQLDEHIVAVKGTLELIDTSLPEDELHGLLTKAIERMDTIQRLTTDMMAALKSCLTRMGESGK